MSRNSSRSRRPFPGFRAACLAHLPAVARVLLLASCQTQGWPSYLQRMLGNVYRAPPTHRNLQAIHWWKAWDSCATT